MCAVVVVASSQTAESSLYRGVSSVVANAEYSYFELCPMILEYRRTIIVEWNEWKETKQTALHLIFYKTAKANLSCLQTFAWLLLTSVHLANDMYLN